MPNPCPHSKQGNVVLQRILKKEEKKRIYEKGIKKPKPQHGSNTAGACTPELKVMETGPQGQSMPGEGRGRSARQPQQQSGLFDMKGEINDDISVAEACELCNNNNQLKGH